MLKETTIIFLILIGIGVATFMGTNLSSRLNLQPEHALGSVVQGSEYHSTSTLASTAAGLYRLNATGTPAVLGSVIITSSSGSIFTILDGDNTVTTTVAIFKASAAEGTYTFDVATYKGLTIQVPASFTGHFVTTYR